MTKSSVVFLIFFLGTPLAPDIVAVACILVFGLQLAVFVVRQSARALLAQPWSARPRSTTPIFSVHLATCNEPPELVRRTIDALAHQDYPSHLWELIVIDNNTVDPALWQPVRRFCSVLGARYKFLHREGVKGAKAGALNIALEYSRADTTHVVTIDADYIAEPTFLSEAARALATTGADYVQFPQAYQRSNNAAEGVDIELQEYFLSDARTADDAEAVLLTGTLCIISSSALRMVGGWSGYTATEDAELGVRLCGAGFRGHYIPTVVARGLLPLSFNDLEKQRYRWASGNLRTLLLHVSNLLDPKVMLRRRQVLAIVAQLCAWLNFGLIPAACLLAAAITNETTPTLANITSLSLLFGLGETLTRLFLRLYPDGYSFKAVLSAAASRLALAPVSARATVSACIPGPQSFVVTRKNAARGEPVDLPVDQLMLFCMALVAIWALVDAPLLHRFGAAVLLLPLPASVWVSIELSRYRKSVHLTNSNEVIA